MKTETGIYRKLWGGEREEVLQEHIDYWCKHCQFPPAGKRCRTKALIQQCWRGSLDSASNWHQQRECPFIHKGEACRCNDFPTIAGAFQAAGINYKS